VSNLSASIANFSGLLCELLNKLDITFSKSNVILQVHILTSVKQHILLKLALMVLIFKL